jgi:hypothetical protein
MSGRKLASQGWTAHGLGKLTFPDKKSFYSGPFIDGEPSGKGKFVQVRCDHCFSYVEHKKCKLSHYGIAYCTDIEGIEGKAKP